MKIELYKADKLSQKGSSLRNMIMNKDMPVLDLLIRESIQNSLDAKDDSSKSKFVNVDFTINTFDKRALDKELDGVSLTDRPLWGNRFLAIRDSNTVGLTGEYSDKKSNLYKLVYGIMEAQQASGAGGSWGIGKTVYFRIGVGLVLYYSRIKTAKGYEQLIAADLVEDETKSDAILPPADGQKYGIAWWGEKIKKSEEVKECRNSATINRILKAFNLAPYTGNSTGTTIIIPFIDEASLLANNQPKLESDERPPFWMGNIKDYIKIAVQRWYAARLNNKKYPLGKYLNVTINGRGISPQEMEPFFKLSQVLYNKAALSIFKKEDADKIKFEDIEIYCEDISVRSEINPSYAGSVAFAKVTRKQLGMVVPTNCPSPYEYIKSSSEEDEDGKPIIMFCRKPGMVVSYETDSKWTASIPNSGEDYIIGYFVINSNATIQNIDPPMLLEDYARKSELADHTSWNDCDLGGLTPKVLAKIKKNTSAKIGSAFIDNNEDETKTTDTGLSSLLGKVLLPPEGFGRRPSSSAKGSGSSTTTQKNLRYTYFVQEYTSSGMVISIHATSGKKKTYSFGCEMRMDSMTGPITCKTWEEEMGLETPFYINSIKMTINKLDGEKKNNTLIIKEKGIKVINGIQIDNLLTKQNNWIGSSFKFEDEEEHAIDINISIDLTIRRKDIKPIISFDF